MNLQRIKLKNVKRKHLWTIKFFATIYLGLKVDEANNSKIL